MSYLVYILFIFLLSTVNSSQSRFSSISRLNTFEIENYKYQIDIDKNVKLASSSTSSSLSKQDDLLEKNSIKSPNVITLKNIHGQSYDCYLPDNFNDDDDYDDNIEVNNVELKKSSNSSENSQLNFTLIDEKIKKFSESLKNSNICLYKVSKE